MICRWRKSEAMVSKQADLPGWQIAGWNGGDDGRRPGNVQDRRGGLIFMGTAYKTDVIAWANEQAALLRSGNLAAIDVEHIAEEIEDVGKSEQRELASCVAVLLSHLLKWQYQPSYRGASWEKTIKAQRKEIEYSLKETPSLMAKFSDTAWLEVVWAKAVAQAVSETGLDVFPEDCPWSMDQIMDEKWKPGDSGHLRV